MTNRLHLVFQPGELAHDLRSASGLPAQRLRRLIGHQHSGK
jgi:hypothetical protein